MKRDSEIEPCIFGSIIYERKEINGERKIILVIHLGKSKSAVDSYLIPK